MARPIYAQLSLPALRGNLARARALAPETQLMAVVKANAYGHGLMRVLPALAEADGLALLELDAAIALRAEHYVRRILSLEVFVKVNSGMNRLGIMPADVTRIVERLNHCESVAVLRLMTHLARADED